MESPKSLQPIWNRFVANMGSLWMLVQEIGNLADEIDNEETTQLLKSTAEIFGASLADVESELAERDLPGSDAEIDLTPELTKKLEAEFADFRSQEVQANYLGWLKENPSKIKAWYKVIQSVTKQPPARGKILRRGALIMMFSFYELLISDLIKAYYRLYPEALPAPDDQHISLRDLRGMNPSGLNDIEKFFIEKEVDKVLRESTKKQLQYFKDLLTIQLPMDTKLREALKEISQRRNLIVHNDGIVDSFYLANVPKEFCEARGIEKNVRLNVTPVYILHAYEALFGFSCQLVQLCWRKWFKDDAGKADQALSDSIFSLLEKERYFALKELAIYSTSAKPSPMYEQLITVNTAIAARDSGDRITLTKQIKRISGYPLSSDTKIALSVLREDFEKTFVLLEEAKDEGKTSHMSIDWPLFRPLRKDPRLISFFEEDSQPS
jgi:hypothetical protein